eukprot:TRINITY_DN1424_c2_g1_i1.p2 TRINITY_DN1424_c2_g1~~TRINITY_DN1424_c2_g1_i1.p2  ORF type:complete len:121 (+),score=1.88 TRINITY_DN1424_c2_g1_i1:205-567(+)
MLKKKRTREGGTEQQCKETGGKILPWSIKGVDRRKGKEGSALCVFFCCCCVWFFSVFFFFCQVPVLFSFFCCSRCSCFLAFFFFFFSFFLFLSVVSLVFVFAFFVFFALFFFLNSLCPQK